MVAAVERCFREVCAGGLGLPLAAASHGDAEVPPPARKKNFFHDF
ncbi:MAG TPA: hypothetical protein VLT61_05230 [Anaeromyxobacteraceae bacterium]|nr:hypothetical protein [Anaeromyxobacteraceae bacterium]